MRSAFVTGAYGLLGGWLCKALLDAGVRVVVLKRDEVPLSALELEGAETRCAVVHGDITDYELLGRVLTEY
jgi:CDP-glucose 4,6-dehydratase